MASPEPEKSSETKDFIKYQIETIDRLLLNAYGTVYKLATKNMVFKGRECLLSERTEMLTAKTIMSNLWSVLDYCCILLYCEYNNRQPRSQDARRQTLKFPCAFRNDLQKKPNDWETKKIKEMVRESGEISNGFVYKGIFSEVQHWEDPEGVAVNQNTEHVFAFYALHFLRNTLTHNNIKITGDDLRSPELVLNILRIHNITSGPPAAITIQVPRPPWSDNSCNNHEDYKALPLVDVLFDSCEVVKELRNRMFTLLNEEKFEEKFRFTVDCGEHLIITLLQRNQDSGEWDKKALGINHMECYGVDVDLKDTGESDSEDENDN